MAVSKTDYATYHTLEGNLAEVAGALTTNEVSAQGVVGFGSHDGTAFWAVYKDI